MALISNHCTILQWNRLLRIDYLSFIFLLVLAACQPTAELSSTPTVTNEPVARVILPPPTQTPTLRPPAVQMIIPTATDQPAFALPSSEELATSTPVPTSTPTPLPTGTATPPPTFTPPSLPGTSPNEHYWLYRPLADGEAVWTIKSYPYGSTRDGTLRPHHGVEFQAASGTGIYAASTGTVVIAGSDAEITLGPHNNFYGNVIVIEHESSFNGQPVFSLYGHLSEVGVVVGQRVEARQLIGLSGASGVADGSHLHLEVRVGSNHYNATRNPSLWLYPFDDHGTIAGRVVFPNGALAENAQVTATRLDAQSVYKGSTTYVGQSINSDDGWGENFVIDDVNAGYYLVTVSDGNKRYKEEIWVYEYQTTFVEIEIPLP